MARQIETKSGRTSWKISLRVKSLLAILLAVISVFLIMTIVVDPIIKAMFSQEEVKDTGEKIQQGMVALQSELSDLSNRGENWASSDDTYAFMVDGNEDYIRANLNDNTFVNDRLNLVLFLSPDGKVVWGNSYDTIRSKQGPVPSALIDYFTHHPLTETTVTGITTTGPGPLMVSLSPVLTSSGKGPARGTLILGRTFDQLEIQRLNKASHLSTGIFPLNGPENPPDIAPVMESILQEPVVVQPMGSDDVRGYTLISDLEGNPALVFTIDTPRTVYSNGMEMWQYFRIALLAISIVYLAISFLIMELTVLAPISHLSERVRDIGKSGHKRRIPVSGHDEVTGLGETINGMLDALDESEKTLKESEARFRLLAENARDLIYRIELSPERKFIYLSPALKTITGYEPQELYADYNLVQKLIYSDDLPAFQENLQKQPGGNSPIVTRFVKKDGAIIWMEASNTIITNENGEVFAEGVARDITERQKAEEQVTNIAKFPNEDPNPVMRITRTGNIVYTNKSSLPLLTTWQGKNEPGLPKKVPENLMTLVRNSVDSGQVKEIEITCGERIFSLAFTPVVNEEYINIYGHDITERKRAEEERNKLFSQETDLRKALEEEIEKRTEFTRALVHELKTPLTPILASSDILVEELHDDPYLRLAKNINQGALNLNNRIDELLDLARGEIGMLRLNPKPVDTARLLHDVFEFTAASALSANELISMEMPGSLPEVIADEERLRQVLLNFINNAIKYSDPGSKILIRAYVEGDNLVFQIKDTGHGLDEKEMERLFQPYHRLIGDRERLSGLGLGLALSKTLIELHHGRVWVESKKGVGSTFSFSIPIKKVPTETV